MNIEEAREVAKLVEEYNTLNDHCLFLRTKASFVSFNSGNVSDAPIKFNYEIDKFVFEPAKSAVWNALQDRMTEISRTLQKYSKSKE